MKIFIFICLCFLSCSNLALTEAQRQLSQNQYDKAAEIIASHLKEKPTDSHAWYILGNIYAEKRDYIGMNDAFSKSIKYNPKNTKKINSYKKRHFNYIVEKITEDLNNIKRFKDLKIPEAQKLAVEIERCIKIAKEIYPNDKRIPSFNHSKHHSENVYMPNAQLERYRNSNIAIMELSGNNILRGTASAVTNRLFHELFKRKFYNLLERDKMEEILEEQSFQLSGCVSSECLVEVGRLLNVELMLGGSISKVGNLYMIDLRLINVETGKILLTANEDISGDFLTFIKIALPRIAKKLTYN